MADPLPPAFVVTPILQPDAALQAAVFELQQRAHALEAGWLDFPELPRLWPCVEDLGRDPRPRLAAFDGEGRLAGVLVYDIREPDEGEEADGVVHIDRLMVDPDRLGQGWAGRLLTRLLALYPHVTVHAARNNPAALAAYHKAGFAETGAFVVPGDLVMVSLAHRRGDDVGDGPLLAMAEAGWVAGARRCPSPNQNPRPEGVAADLLIVHNISLPPYRYGSDAVERFFTNTLDPAADPFFEVIWQRTVSAHFFIRRSGELVQFVPVQARAWHAGVSAWQGREGCNDFSVGVELEGCDVEPYTDSQYRTLIALARLLRRALPIRDMVGHADVAPGRKTDPGPWFDWERFRRGVDGMPVSENSPVSGERGR